MIQAEAGDAGETPTRYVLVESDRFEGDLDRAILSVNRILGPVPPENGQQSCHGT